MTSPMSPPPPEEPDPTLVRAQPSLHTGSSRLWLVTGGVLAAVSIGAFVWTAPLSSPVSIAGIVAVVVAYTAMIVVASLVLDPRRRSLAFAVVMVAMVIAVLGLMIAHVVVQGGG